MIILLFKKKIIKNQEKKSQIQINSKKYPIPT